MFVLLAYLVQLGNQSLVVILGLLVHQRRQGLVLELVADLLDHLELAVVAPEEDVADDFLGLGPKLGIRLDHHGDHVLKLLLPLLNKIFADFV